MAAGSSVSATETRDWSVAAGAKRSREGASGVVGRQLREGLRGDRRVQRQFTGLDAPGERRERGDGRSLGVGEVASRVIAVARHAGAPIVRAGPEVGATVAVPPLALSHLRAAMALDEASLVQSLTAAMLQAGRAAVARAMGRPATLRAALARPGTRAA